MRFGTPTIPSALEFRQTEYGWNQARMAKALGMQTSHYSEVLSGKRRLPYMAACRAFKIGVPVKVLLSITNRRSMLQRGRSRAPERRRIEVGVSSSPIKGAVDGS